MTRREQKLGAAYATMSPLKYQIIHSAGRDTATRQAKKSGRTAWNRADWNAACREMDRLALTLDLLPRRQAA